MALVLTQTFATSADLTPPSPFPSAAGGGSGDITSPLDIPGCALWLDASTLALADNAAVATWPDGSGNGYDATQATANNRPVCKTNVQNGLRIVRFDPTSFPQYLGFSGAALDLVRALDGFTIAAVWRLTANWSADYVFQVSDGLSVTNQRVLIEGPSSGGQRLFGATNTDGGTINNTADVAMTTVGWGVSVAAVDAVNGGIVNDTSPPGRLVTPTYADSPGPMANTASLRILIGAALGLSEGITGDIAELIVWQRALNAKERRQVLEYLSAKWATL